jgi:hypothetical protein
MSQKSTTGYSASSASGWRLEAIQTSLGWIGVDGDDSNSANSVAAVAPGMIGAALHEYVACL